MTLTQILQKIRSAFYTKAETDATYLKDITNSYSQKLLLIKGDGTVSEFEVKQSYQAEHAQKDWNGNNIIDTYSTKTELTNGLNSKANDANVVHKSGNETIAGNKTFSNVTYLNKEISYKDTKYDWTNTSLDTWCDAGHVSWLDKTGNRRMHELVGTKGGVWEKACFINGKQYFNVDSNRNITYWGTTLTLNGERVLTVGNGVTLDTEQTISGVKTFSSKIKGNISGNADTATKATNNASGNELSNNIIKGLSVNGKVITYTKLDGSTGTITTQDTNTWTALKGATSSANGTAGYVPAPTKGAANRYLRCDGTWQVPPDNNTTYSFSNKAATLAWNTAVTVATVGGVDITVKLPANPNTNTTYSAGTNMSLSGTTFSTSSTPTFSRVTVTNNRDNGLLFGSYRVYVG